MTEMNGTQHHPVDLDEAARRDLQRLAASSEPSIQVHETLPLSPVAFDQKAHDLLIRSIDQVTADWVGQLERTRQNSKAVEQLVMERAAKVRSDITALYLLGSAAQAEARRGDEVNARLAGELDKLAEHHPT